MEDTATIYGRKLTDKGGRLFIDGVEILRVRGMDLNKIGPTGSPIEVTLHLDVDEVDIRYSNFKFLE